MTTERSSVGDGCGEGLQELAAGQRVKRGHRLVEQQESRALCQDQAQADLGTLATREGGDRPVRRNLQRGESCPGSIGIPVAIEVRADLSDDPSALSRL